MSNLRIFLLGPVQFNRDEQPIELSAAKAVALLAYLALADAPYRREMLADLLWPQSLPQAAQKNLSNTLWMLRKMLGDNLGNNVVKTDGNQVMLADGVWIDSQQFETTVQALLTEDTPAIDALQAALQLYRGPLLDGIAPGDAPDFETWVRTEQTRFNELYLRGVETLVAAHRARGNWQNVIPLARQAIRYDNLRESMVQALMEAQAQLGERRGALRDYDTLRTALTTELGINPLPETETLHRAILSGAVLANGEESHRVQRNGEQHTREQPVSRSGSAPSKLPPHAKTQRSRPQQARLSQRPSGPPFVGRLAEQKALDEEFQLAADGQARVIFLTGELGIGKTRLWQSWSATLSAKLPTSQVVLQTRCLDTTQSLPFAPLTRLFRQSDYIENLFQPPSPLSPVWLAELAHLLPEIRQAWPEIPTRITVPPDEERLRLFEAFTQALRTLKDYAQDGCPLVLFIDDLHWTDQATLDWLVYFVDRMRSASLLLVAAYRPSDAPARLIQQIANWGKEGVARHLPIPRLTLEEATALVTPGLVTPGLVTSEQLYAKSGGNPYFLLELNRSPAGETPPALAELVRARLDGLPEAARQVVQAAAVLETDLDFVTLGRTGGRSEEETVNALELLVAGDFLVEGGHGYEFVHPLVRAIVHDNLSIPRRSILHGRAAAALKAIHAGDETLVVGRLATHYAQAGYPTQAAHYAELAAARALALAGPSEAIAFYQQAMALEPTPTRQMGLGKALFAQGLWDEARLAWQDAAVSFEALGDKTGVARAYVIISDSYRASGQGTQIIHWAERALLAAETEPDPEVTAQAHLLLASGSLLIERSLDVAERHLVQAIHLATDNDLPGIASQSQFLLGTLSAEKGDLPQALQAYKQAIALTHVIGDHYTAMLGHNNLAYHALLADDLVTARKHIDIALALAETHFLFLPRQFLYSTRGEIALAEGTLDGGAADGSTGRKSALDEAESWFTRALAEAERKNGNQIQAISIRANLGLVARARGELDTALTLLSAASTAVANLSATHLQTKIDLWLAELYLQRCEPSTAGEALSRAEDRLVGSERQGLQAWASRVRASFIIRSSDEIVQTQ